MTFSSDEASAGADREVVIDPERELAAPPDLPEPPDDAAGEPLVADIMSRRLVAVRSDVDLMVAVDVFLRHAVRHLLVVDPDRTFRGLLSAEHVLAAIATIGRGRPSRGRPCRRPAAAGPA